MDFKKLHTTCLLYIRISVYMMVLAHFFIPHHHHTDFTTHLNSSQCSHQHGSDDEDSNSVVINDFSDCELLAYTLIEDSDHSIPSLDFEGDNDFNTIYFGDLYSFKNIYSIKNNGPPKIFIESKVSKPNYKNSPLRGPPSLLS